MIQCWNKTKKKKKKGKKTRSHVKQLVSCVMVTSCKLCDSDKLCELCEGDKLWVVRWWQVVSCVMATSCELCDADNSCPQGSAQSLCGHSARGMWLWVKCLWKWPPLVKGPIPAYSLTSHVSAGIAVGYHWSEFLKQHQWLALSLSVVITVVTYFSIISMVHIVDTVHSAFLVSVAEFIC